MMSEKLVVDFIASIADVPWFRPQGDPDPTWEVFETRNAADDAADDAVFDAVFGDTYNAASDAAFGAGRIDAFDAAYEAAYDAVYHDDNAVINATHDAGLMAGMLVVTDVIDQKHIDHAVARWEVWQSGRGLLCDVDGVLYVYERMS